MIDSITLQAPDPVALADGDGYDWTTHRSFKIFEMSLAPDDDTAQMSINWYCIEGVLDQLARLVLSLSHTVPLNRVQKDLDQMLVTWFRITVTGALLGDVVQDPMDEAVMMGRLEYTVVAEGSQIGVSSVALMAIKAMEEQNWQEDSS